jgi:multiple sugar transport system permease protein
LKIYRKDMILHSILMLPALALIALFVIVPALWAVFISFTNQSLLGRQATGFEFVGLDNYMRLLTDKDFWNSGRLTVIFVLVSAVLGQSLLGLALALLFKAEKGLLKAAIGSAAVLAWIIPEIVAVYIWASTLTYEAGLANQLLSLVGIEHQRWLIDMPMFSLTIVAIWRGAAFSMLLFSSSLEAIPTSLYEASAVDGAGAWKRFVLITLPLIRPTILINLILVTISGFAAFGIVFAMTGGGPLGQTEIISVYIYRNAFQARELGYASAASVVMFAWNVILGGFYFWFLRDKTAGRQDHEN